MAGGLLKEETMEAHIESQGNVVREISLPIFQSKSWLKLLGVLSIIYGAITALTVVGIVFAWLPIWMGVLLYQAASAVERSQATGDKQALIASLNKIKTYFTVSGVLAILGLIGTIICMIIAMTMGALGIMLDAMH